MSVLRYGLAARTATYWNLYVAQQEGLYAAERLEVQPLVTGGTAQTIEAVLAGQVDVGGCSPDELISAAQRGADLVVVGGIIGRPVSWIIGQPGLTALAELRGRRIGVNALQGSVSMVFRAALRGAGLERGEYQQVPVGTTPIMVTALRRGEVDAAMLTAPFDLELLREGFSPLLNVGEQLPIYAFTTLNASRRWVLDHPDELAAFFRATRNSGDLIANPAQRDLCLRALATATGLSGEALDRSYQVYQQPGVLSRHGEVARAGLEMVARLMAAEGLLPSELIDVGSLLLPRWLEA